MSAPWQVEQVTLLMEPGEMEVWVAPAGATPFGCPECAAPRLSHDHVEWRWRQLDIIRFRALLCARGPRVRCSTQVVRTTPVLWAESGTRWSLPFVPRWTPKSGHQWTPENRPPQAS